MGVLVTGILHFLLPAGNLRNPAAQHHRGARDVKCIKAKGIAGTEQERQASKGCLCYVSFALNHGQFCPCLQYFSRC